MLEYTYAAAVVARFNTEDIRGTSIGNEGYADIFSTLESKIKSPAICFQLETKYELRTVEDVASSILPHIVDKLKGRSEFMLVGYSFGSLIAIELTRMLEAKGFIGRLILIDGAPQYLKKCIQENFHSSSLEELGNNILYDIINAYESGKVLELLIEKYQFLTSGIKDLNSINPRTPLPDLGMDSMTAIEIKQTLEREYDIYLTGSDIRNLNFAKLIEMNNKSTDNSNQNENDTNQILSITNMLRQLFGEVFSTELAIPLKTNPAEGRREIFFLPGIEGYADIFKTLESNIKSPATCFQFALNYESKTVEAMANSFLPLILEKLKDRNDFLLVGYSFGSVLAIELTRMLEIKGFIGRLILIDGAPQHLKTFIQQNLHSSSEEELDNNILLDIMNAYVGLNVVELELELKKCNSWDEKLNAFFNVLSPEHKELFLKEDRRKAIHSLHLRLQAVMAYNPEPMPYLRTPIILFKPQFPSVSNAAHDYGLKNITEAKVDVRTVEGNHITMLCATEISMAINDELFDAATFTENVRGDLSTIRWVEGPITKDYQDEDLVGIHYAALNFKDVMLSTGKISQGANSSRKNIDYVIGFEYSGKTISGRRIMGVKQNRCLSNFCQLDKTFSWTVPEGWTLEDAATVPCVYCTCIAALYINGVMQKGDRILIHAGSGGIGQAAINLALHEGCEVFTTVGTPEKRKFIKETFPSIDDNHIGNSRDTSFEKMVLEGTNGAGVDIVLNSLSEDKFQASLRCLALRGRFLEIGKFDLTINNELSTKIFMKGISFHGTNNAEMIAVYLLLKNLREGLHLHHLFVAS
uniref:oleoyl-[acyl-carrier-protein] hydrolase n=1 Tax=Vespula pensylvanica TaxID=30213 RepID=A0A834UCQ7_VESPE|nr:hypothetical protein H0235_004463 [Vespula pensylvanica]